jgi:3-phenylpropionate/cinnamic acid dioxygenase small subunit
MSVAEDLLLIQNLSAHYALAMDECRFEDWMGFWCTEDACFENPAGQFIGKEGFERLIPVLQTRVAGKRHFMTNMAIDVTGETATQTCYMLIVLKGTPPTVVGTAVYRDELVKVGGVWKFKKRKVEFDA